MKVLTTLSFITLIVIALFLIFNEQIYHEVVKSSTNQYHLSQLKKDDIVKNLKKADENQNKQSETKDAINEDTINRAESHKIAMIDAISHKLNQTKLPVVGLIAIPDVQINLPIFEGVTEDTIMYGAATVTDDRMGKGNYALASHHVFDNVNTRLFSPLKRAKVGQRIFTTDLDKVYVYEITNIFVVDKTRVDVLDSELNQTLLTLITCEDLDAEYRTIVRARFIQSYDYSLIDTQTKGYFEKDFNL